MGALAWKVLGTGAALLAGLVARKLITSLWKMSTGHEPPVNPEDPETSWGEAVGWAVASGVTIGLARLLATRKAAEFFTKSAGHPPEGMNEVT